MQPVENNSSNNIVVCVKNSAAASEDGGVGILCESCVQRTPPLSPLVHAARKWIWGSWGDTNSTHAHHSQHGAFCSIPDTHTDTHLLI